LASEEAEKGQLRIRGGLFVANGSRPTEKPRPCDSFGFDAAPTALWFFLVAIYKYVAPMGLGNAPLALNSTAVFYPHRMRRGWASLDCNE